MRPVTLPPSAALSLVLLAAVWLHVSALRLPFFADDYLFLDQVRGRSLLAAWTSPDPLHNFWRPIGRQLYFWLVGQLGESAVAAHALNLAIFLAIVAMLFVLARRLAGPRAAMIAASLVALHYAADVPVHWASGSQDLIAIAGALGALCLLAAGHGLWAAVSLGLGLLAKETVVVTPLVALVLARRTEGRWSQAARRVWPLAAAVAVWAILWILAMRGRSGGTVGFSLGAIPAAPVHLLQVFLGAEWGRSLPLPALGNPPPLGPLALALAAIALVGRRREETPARATAGVWTAGLAWAALGSLPVMAVAHIWSAYYYLFALCGLALAAAVFLDRRRVVIAMGAVALLAWGSENGRRLEAFATTPGNWTISSHLNRFYFDRSMWWVTRYLEDLRRQRPILPHGSTVFFAGTQAWACWQAADGPLVRWAYRDSSLRSYYLGSFSVARARRGPVFLFFARHDSLIEQPGGSQGLMLAGLGQALSDQYTGARDALTIALEGSPDEPVLHYWLAWVGLALGDTAACRRELVAAGCDPRPGPSIAVAAARRLVAAGDSTTAMSQLADGIRANALDPEAHGLMSDLIFARDPQSTGGVVEALAARVLSPLDPWAWRRWAGAQVLARHSEEGYASLTRYFELAGPAGQTDEQARQLLERLRQNNPGGEMAEVALRRRPLPRN